MFTLLASLGERTWADRRLGARYRGRADRTCKCHLSSHPAFWFSVALMHQTVQCKGQNIFLKNNPLIQLQYSATCAFILHPSDE